MPFLLAVLPNAKSLGHINVLRGLKMIRDIPGLNGIVASNIEEIDIGFGNDQVCIQYLFLTYIYPIPINFRILSKLSFSFFINIAAAPVPNQ